MNDEFFDENWYSADLDGRFFRPATWPDREPLVRILAYTLMPNHFHLLLKEIREGGISAFMQKLCQSMTNYHNEKYDQQGSIFQGSYRGRTIENDNYLRYVSAYIMVKNVFELYPKGGLRGATEHFEDAWEWGIEYKYSSLSHYANSSQLPIIEKDLLGEIFTTPRSFKNFARDVIEGGKWLQAEFE
ncbi:MAG: transposase [bacterium]|nr:transposase [bacterium]